MSEFIGITLVILYAGFFVWSLKPLYLFFQSRERILPDPFYVEILHNQEVIGYLSEREKMDYGWEQYTVIPLNHDGLDWYPQLLTMMRNDDVIFRDPKTQMLSVNGYTAPEMCFQENLLQGKIVLRDLYFTKPQFIKDKNESS